MEIEVKEGLTATKSDIQFLKQQYDLFRELQKQVLEENVDYGYPGGRKDGKPTLYKSGAEKLTRLFRLVTHFEMIEKTEREDYVAYLFKCTLSTRNGIVGEGYGTCNSKEKKHWEQNPLGNANTILKIAKKRSHIDSVLTGLGASNVFTQDLEDEIEIEQKASTQPTQKVTEKQLKLIYALINELAKATESPKDEIAKEIKEKYGVEHSTELTIDQASSLINELQQKIALIKAGA